MKSKSSAGLKRFRFNGNCCLMFIAIIVLFIFIIPLVVFQTQEEIITDIKTINPDGTRGRVFVAYSPGVSSFQEDMTYAFIEGLEENDWNIDITTISSETPVDLSSYDLFVIGSYTAGGEPSKFFLDYFERLGDLNNTDVAIVMTSGASEDSLTFVEDMINNANGTIIKSIILSILVNGINGWELSYQAGKSIE